MSDRPATSNGEPINRSQSMLKSGKNQDFKSYPDVYWNTVFIDGKFYIAHPLELDKLMKLEVEIRKEKNKLNLNQNTRNLDKQEEQDDRTEKSEVENFRPLSALSRDCKTQINQSKQLKSKVKAQQDLITEEQKYQQRLAQIKKKKEGKQGQILTQDLKNSNKKSQKKSEKQKQKSGFEQGVIIPQEFNKSKVSEKKSQARKSQKVVTPQEQNSEKPKEQWRSSGEQKNYISFHPDDDLKSPKFEMNKTKTAKFRQNEEQSARSNNRYSGNNTSKLGNKSFVVNLRKTPSNSKDARQSQSNSRRDLKSASSAASRIQLETLNKKIKEMQQKLLNVQQKQKQFQQFQKSRVISANQKNEVIQTEQIPEPSQKPSQKPSDKRVSANSRYNEELKQSSLQKHKLQSSSQLQCNNLNSNQSSANDGSVRRSKQSQVFDVTIYRTKKLNIASSIVQYNYTEDYAKMKKQIEETNQKERMVEEISDLKRMIRQLKLERIKHESMIEQLEKKQKQKEKEKDLNSLLNSKLDQKTPQSSKLPVIRLPTQKRQKTQPKQSVIFAQNTEQQSPKQKKQKKNKMNLKIDVGDDEEQQPKRQKPSELKKVDSYQSPNPKKDKLQPIKLGTDSSFNKSNKKLQSISKMNINSKQLNNTSFNPQQPSYREFHPYPLNRRGIVVRQVLEKQEKGTATNQSDNKYQKNKDYSVDAPSPLSTGRKIFELQFVKQIKKKTEIIEQQPDLTPPNIKLSTFNIPKLPQTPATDVSQTELLGLAKSICNTFRIKVQSDDHIYMKKYKNCIIFKTPDVKKTVVWHYSGKFYIGGWDQNENGEGKKNGEGFQYVPEKHYYQGQFLDGKKNGSGTMIMVNGNIYKGQWVQGQKQGLGIYYQKSTESMYQGEWKQDKKDGKGILKISDNEFYDGTFVKSIKHGYGLQVFSNGDYYKGEYKIGRFHGKGRYAWKNGASYDGSFVQGRRQGTGRWKSSKTEYDLYFGEYKNDKKSGKGQYTWNNGTVYEGNFVNDLKHGEGKVQYPDGRQIRGYWQSGKLVEVDQNIEESQTSSNRNESIPKGYNSKFQEISSKQLQPSRKLTKL